MKNISIVLILLLLCLTDCKTKKLISSKNSDTILPQPPLPVIEPTQINFSYPSTWILGYFKQEKLTREPYSSWYLKEYDDYQINGDAINKLMDIKKDEVKIKIVMGTWCPDSRREVPRMIRILDIWRFPMAQVSFIGVDKAKHTSVSEYESLKIERVPTFIIYKNNLEAGRIIETPLTSLEQDIVNILTRNE